MNHPSKHFLVSAAIAGLFAGHAAAYAGSFSMEGTLIASAAAVDANRATMQKPGASVVPNLPGKIVSLNFTKPLYAPNEAVAYTVQGSGQACRFHLRFSPNQAIALAPSTNNTPPPQPVIPPELSFPKFGPLPLSGTQNEGIGAGLIKPWRYTVIAEATAEDKAKGDACTGKALVQLDIGSGNAEAAAAAIKPH